MKHEFDFNTLHYRLRLEQARHSQNGMHFDDSMLRRPIAPGQSVAFREFMNWLWATKEVPTAFDVVPLVSVLLETHAVFLKGAAYTASQNAVQEYTQLAAIAADAARAAWYQLHAPDGCVLHDEEQGLYVMYCLFQVLRANFDTVTLQGKGYRAFKDALPLAPANHIQQHRMWQQLIIQANLDAPIRLRQSIQYFVFELDRFYMTLPREKELRAELHHAFKETVQPASRGKAWHNVLDTLPPATLEANAVLFCPLQSQNGEPSKVFARQVVELFSQHNQPQVRGALDAIDLTRWDQNQNSIRGLYQLNQPLMVPPPNTGFPEKPMNLTTGLSLVPNESQQEPSSHVAIHHCDATLAMRLDIMLNEATPEQQAALQRKMPFIETALKQIILDAIRAP